MCCFEQLCCILTLTILLEGEFLLLSQVFYCLCQVVVKGCSAFCAIHIFVQSDKLLNKVSTEHSAANTMFHYERDVSGVIYSFSFPPHISLHMLSTVQFLFQATAPSSIGELQAQRINTISSNPLQI